LAENTEGKDRVKCWVPTTKMMSRSMCVSYVCVMHFICDSASTVRDISERVGVHPGNISTSVLPPVCVIFPPWMPFVENFEIHGSIEGVMEVEPDTTSQPRDTGSSIFQKRGGLTCSENASLIWRSVRLKILHRRGTLSPYSITESVINCIIVTKPCGPVFGRMRFISDQTETKVSDVWSLL